MKLLAKLSRGAIVAAAAISVAVEALGQGLPPPAQPQGQGREAAPQRGAERTMPQRDMRGTGEGDRGRMSQDERRQLRRDIQDAGKDIYRPGRQGPAHRGRPERG